MQPQLGLQLLDGAPGQQPLPEPLQVQNDEPDALMPHCVHRHVEQVEVAKRGVEAPTEAEHEFLDERAVLMKEEEGQNRRRHAQSARDGDQQHRVRHVSFCLFLGGFLGDEVEPVKGPEREHEAVGPGCAPQPRHLVSEEHGEEEVDRVAKLIAEKVRCGKTFALEGQSHMADEH